jgi:hypothetical protein
LILEQARRCLVELSLNDIMLWTILKLQKMRNTFQGDILCHHSAIETKDYKPSVHTLDIFQDARQT